MISNLLATACLLLAAGGAISDLLRRRIPNLLCLACLALTMPLAYMTGGSAALASGMIHAAIALVAGMLLFRFSFIGGGDAKFYATLAPAVPLGKALAMLGWTSVSGLVLLIVMMATRRLTAPDRRTVAGMATVPYGVAIASGFFIVIVGDLLLPPSLVQS